MNPKGYLTTSEVEGFQNLSQKVFGKTLTSREAEDQGIRLIRLFELIIEQKKAHNREETICQTP